MTVPAGVAQPLDGLPSKNVQYLLFIVGNVGRVEGRVKLFKLHHLLQTEAKAIYDKPDEENELGYTQFNALNSCINGCLVHETVASGVFNQDRFDYTLTQAGSDIYTRIMDEMPKSEKERVLKVLNKYKDFSGSQLIGYTHKQYIDQFDVAKTISLSEVYAAAIDEITQIMTKFVEDNKDTERYIMLGKLEHVNQILAELAKEQRKKIQAGTILVTVRELIQSLKANMYVPDESSRLLFEYLDNYAAKERIVPSLSESDFSALSGDDKKCLSEFLNQLQTQISS